MLSYLCYRSTRLVVPRRAFMLGTFPLPFTFDNSVTGFQVSMRFYWRSCSRRGRTRNINPLRTGLAFFGTKYLKWELDCFFFSYETDKVLLVLIDNNPRRLRRVGFSIENGVLAKWFRVVHATRTNGGDRAPNCVLNRRSNSLYQGKMVRPSEESNFIISFS